MSWGRDSAPPAPLFTYYVFGIRILIGRLLQFNPFLGIRILRSQNLAVMVFFVEVVQMGLKANYETVDGRTVRHGVVFAIIDWASEATTCIPLTLALARDMGEVEFKLIHSEWHARQLLSSNKVRVWLLGAVGETDGDGETTVTGTGWYLLKSIVE